MKKAPPPALCSFPHRGGTVLAAPCWNREKTREPRSLLVTWNEQQLGETTCTHSQTTCIRRVTVCTCPRPSSPRTETKVLSLRCRKCYLQEWALPHSLSLFALGLLPFPGSAHPSNRPLLHDSQFALWVQRRTGHKGQDIHV